MAEPQMIALASDTLTAAINPEGAELTALGDRAGRSLMTDADPAFWAKHAPVLFPVIGVTSEGVIRVDGSEYQMPKHGFARDLTWDVVEHDAGRAVLALTDSDATRRHFPFAFRLELAFTLTGATLAMAARIENRSTRDMPAQFGFHPAFAWPLPFGEPREDHRITFAADEPDGLRRITAQGLIAPERRPSPLVGRTLHLRDDLFGDDALVWDPVHSSTLRYGAARGPSLDIQFSDTRALGIWTKPGARFVCIEPWHGIADPEGFTGELHDKPGVFVLAPGEQKRIGMSVTLVP